MKKRPFQLLPALLMSCLPFPPVAAQVTRPAIQAQQQANAVKTAILIGAAQTQAAVAKADATIRSLYQRLDSSARATRTALRRANISQQEQARLQTELDSLRQQQEALIAQLAARDSEYAASIRAYREGLTGLLADNDPRIIAILDRYADGNAAAADELQDLTRIIRKAREAGLRARNGADQRGVASVWLNEKDKGRKTTAQALAAWQEAAMIDAEDFWQWIYIARLQQEAGFLTSATEAAARAKGLAANQREQGLALSEIGDVAETQGRLEDARKAYEEYLAINRALLAANPSSAEAKRDVSISLSRVGDVAETQGRLEDARKAYEEYLVISRALLAANPSSEEAKRDVSVSLSRVGDVARAQGRLEDARNAYEESLMIDRALLSANPSSAVAKRGVSISLSKVGDVARAQNRLEDARKAYEESLMIDRASLAANPSSAEAKRDVSVSLSKVGDVAATQGRLEDARKAYEESLMIDRASLAANPSSAEAKRDVMISHVRLGQLPQGDSHLRSALTIAEEMARDGQLAPSDQKLLEALRAAVTAPADQ